MRLYLSSFRIGDHPEHLVAMIKGPGNVAVIANAMDGAPADVRRQAVELEATVLSDLGLRPSELDLRDYPDAPARLAETLAGFQAVWVRGGNVFMLRHALASSGGDDVLSDLVRRDALVYAGYSAGPCVLAPSLLGLEHCDDPGAVARTYGVPARFDGLGLLDHAFVPHVDSPDHPESSMLNEVAARYRRDGVPHRTLRDGEVLVVSGGVAELV